MDLEVILGATGIFALRVLGNMITTVRLVTLVRGQKIASFLLAIIESLIFAVTIGGVVSNLDNMWNLGAYCLGYAVGGYLGMVLEQHLIQRFVSIEAISQHGAHKVATALRDAGYGATEGWGEGAEGRVGSVTAVVPHQDVNKVIGIIQDVDPKAFVMMDELRAITRGYFRRFLRQER